MGSNGSGYAGAVGTGGGVGSHAYQRDVGADLLVAGEGKGGSGGEVLDTGGGAVLRKNGFSLRTINGERIKTNPNEVYSDPAFWAEYEAIKRDLLAQGKPLYSDALKRDRQKREARHVSRKLTPDDVRLIRATVTPKCSWKSPQVRDMAEQLGCQRETVVRVARYVTHVGVK